MGLLAPSSLPALLLWVCGAALGARDARGGAAIPALPSAGPPSSLLLKLREPGPLSYVEAEEGSRPLSRLHLQADHGLGVLGANVRLSDAGRSSLDPLLRLPRESSQESLASSPTVLPSPLPARSVRRQQPNRNRVVPRPDASAQGGVEVSGYRPVLGEDQIRRLASYNTFCEFGALPAFIRVPQALIMGIPTLVQTTSVVSCAGFCRNNTEPNSGGRRLCQGFNFQDSGAPTCEMFDVEARLGPLNRNVGVRSFYYDKICLEAVESCYARPYAFEAVPDAQLQGNVRKSLVVQDEAQCLSACLKESTFTCSSVNFVRAGRVCELSEHSRRSKLSDFATSVQGVDYYENNCLTRHDRCPGGAISFVKTFNSEIRGFEAEEGQETLNSCLQKCLDSDAVFCRSAEYDRSSSECILSDEDSFSMPGMVSTAEAVGIDLYEPVCLPGPSAAAKTAKCRRPYLFEKVLNTALNVPQHIKVLPGLTPEDCMSMCSREDACASLNYERDTQTCLLSAFDRRNASASLGRAFRVDYYENNCQKANTIQGCFFTLEGVGRKLRPEFRNREVEATSSVDCKMSCIRRGESCNSVSFDEAARRCFHSQLDTKAASFELLAQPDLNFDTYVKGECVFERQGAATLGGPRNGSFTSLAPASPTAPAGPAPRRQDPDRNNRIVLLHLPRPASPTAPAGPAPRRQDPDRNNRIGQCSFTFLAPASPTAPAGPAPRRQDPDRNNRIGQCSFTFLAPASPTAPAGPAPRRQDPDRNNRIGQCSFTSLAPASPTAPAGPAPRRQDPDRNNRIGQCSFTFLAPASPTAPAGPAPRRQDPDRNSRIGQCSFTSLAPASPTAPAGPAPRRQDPDSNNRIGQCSFTSLAPASPTAPAGPAPRRQDPDRNNRIGQCSFTSLAPASPTAPAGPAPRRQDPDRNNRIGQCSFTSLAPASPTAPAGPAPRRHDPDRNNRIGQCSFTSLAPASPTAPAGPAPRRQDPDRNNRIAPLPVHSPPAAPFHQLSNKPHSVIAPDSHRLLASTVHKRERRGSGPGLGFPFPSRTVFHPGLECKTLRLTAEGRRLRRFHSNNHNMTRSLEDCRLLCASKRSYTCLSISYSNITELCSLSELEPSFRDVGELTEPDLNSNFYTTVPCHKGRTKGADDDPATEAPRWQAPRELHSKASEGTDWTTRAVRRRPQASSTTFDPPLLFSPLSPPLTHLPQKLLRILDEEETTTAEEPMTTTEPPPPPTTKTPTPEESSTTAPPLRAKTDMFTAAPKESFGGPTSAAQTSRRGGFFGGEPTPIARQPRVGLGIALSPSSVSLSALCSPDGVNVSVTTIGGYTGAIYAAERFSFCRNLVTGQDSFWLFLPRPELNSACNTIMVNDVLSGVIVISNDNVRPYDVTTKDDLFYQVSCDFAGGGEGGKVIVTGGLVVGGPTPRVVAGAGVQNSFEASLAIRRNGIPVQNVLIGEQLTLNIDSNAEPSRMMLLACNVSRIGGSGPLPEPLTVLDEGCPVVSQVVGPVQRGNRGLFSPLTAFRIDGSAEIQIVCLVMFCPQQCQPVLCPRGDGATVPSLGRRKRSASSSDEEEEEESVVEALNGRLRVFVEGEEGAPSPEELSAGLGQPAGCVAEWTFVAVAGGLGVAVAALLSCLAVLLCRRGLGPGLSHKLIDSPLYGRSTASPDSTARSLPPSSLASDSQIYYR